MSVEGDNIADLSELENFSFQPKWEKQKVEDFPHPHAKNDKKSFRRSGHASNGMGFKKNPWQDGNERKNSSQDGTHPQRFGRSGRDRYGRGSPKTQNFHRPFEPIVDVEFYPNDTVFDAIVSALRSTHKTYELFSVAKLFLEKPERFAMVVKKKDTQADKYLYLTTDDNFIFETENAAVDHVLGNHAGKYFDIEELEVPPPAGKFICLHRCGMTGKVLCPPNYHKYQEILLEHHSRFLPRVPFEKFKGRIEKITSEEEIENWRIQASKVQIFKPKGQEDSVEKIELKSTGEVKKYFIECLKGQAITSYDSVRVSGETFDRMPRSLLSKSIFVLIGREKSFPLNFANNLRGRLGRSGFTIYKIGSKPGISYVSGIRRKFRQPEDIFTDDIQKIIAIIDANPKISITSLCLQYTQEHLGILPDGFEKESDQVQALASTPPEPSSGMENVIVSSLNSPKDSVGQEFFKNLHWLIREGYVIEFEDGTLVSTEIIARKEQPRMQTETESKVVVESTNEDVGNENIPEANEKA
ncbi:MAG: hypothetical protein LBE98_03040 [Puniceicoccales bacterium]|jgi:hypothetical protein|nr:hypothetical protein [Puniceicoccales bacterium]